MTDQKIDLAAEGLLSTAAPEPKTDEPVEAKAPSEEDLAEFVTKTLLAVQDSVGSMQIGIRILSERVAGLEKYVAYLLEKDPVVGPKIKAQADKEEALAKANAEAAAKAGQGG